jgi:hypothetical protein
MKVKTIYGVIEIDPPAGYDPAAYAIIDEGYLPPYKGFQAAYRHGDVRDGEQDKLFGRISNLVHAGILLEGRSMAEFTADFHEAVDEFLLELRDPSHPFSRRGISYYTSDPAILSYYATHYGHVPSSVTGVTELAGVSEPERVSYPLYVPSLGMSV